MGYLVVPQELDPAQGSVELWLGAFDVSTPPGPIDLRVEGAGAPRVVPVAPASWKSARTTPAGAAEPTLLWCRVTVGGLPASSEGRVALVPTGGGAPLAEARFRTLPARLPLEGERPLRVFVGSCFDYRNDKGGNAGRVYRTLAQQLQSRPDLKVLCGDQAYLDVALGVVGGNLGSAWHAQDATPAWFEGKFLETYRQTWEQRGGFTDLLRDGATFFSSDDHEFWNNYPSASPLALGAGPNSHWKGAASRLFDAIQSETRTAAFAIPGLEFFAADTRFNRLEEDFMAEPDFLQLLGWVGGLAGPGVLVLGQPLFATPHRGVLGKLKATFGDWSLPDFDHQYPRLVRALREAPHSVVVLTGDVHFGRIGVTPLNEARGTHLVEVISSPLALVSKAAKGGWKDSPPKFPSESIPGVVRTDVAYTPFIRKTDEPGECENLCTVVELTQDGPRTRLRAFAYAIRDSLLPPRPELVCDLKLA